jgi:AcrR family transcriptional regulator
MKLPERQDRRVSRTRQAILQAFIGLVSERRYESIRVSEIIARADVGRSTFYEHYRGKEDLLHASMKWLLEMIADAALPAGAAQLSFAVAHLWDNRRLARAVVVPPIGLTVRRILTGLVERRLAERSGPPAEPEEIQAKAIQIAAAQLALLEAWTKGELVASQGQIVDALQAATRL